MTSRMKSGRRALWIGAVCGALALGAVGPAQALNINIVNGGFETGDLTGWTLSGNTGFIGVDGNPFQGNFALFAGPLGSLGFISQSFATTVGQNITVSFAWEPDGGVPSEFSVEFDVGTPQERTLLDIVNPAGGFYRVATVSTTALLPTTTLSFNVRDDPGFIFLDAVSAAPEPATLTLLGIGLAGLGFSRRARK